MGEVEVDVRRGQEVGYVVRDVGQRREEPGGLGGGCEDPVVGEMVVGGVAMVAESENCRLLDRVGDPRVLSKNLWVGVQGVLRVVEVVAVEEWVHRLAVGTVGELCRVWCHTR